MKLNSAQMNRSSLCTITACFIKGAFAGCDAFSLSWGIFTIVFWCCIKLAPVSKGILFWGHLSSPTPSSRSFFTFFRQKLLRAYEKGEDRTVGMRGKMASYYLLILTSQPQFDEEMTASLFRYSLLSCIDWSWTNQKISLPTWALSHTAAVIRGSESNTAISGGSTWAALYAKYFVLVVCYVNVFSSCNLW